MSVKSKAKGDVSPMPITLISLIILFLVLVVIYVLGSKGSSSIASLIYELKDCLDNPEKCFVSVLGG